MIVHRGFKFKLYPTPEQEEKFRQFAGVTRLVYNLALEQREKWGRAHKLNFFSQQSELKHLRAQFDFIGAVSQTAQIYALRDLDDVFRRFFRKEIGYPKPRKKGKNESFRFQGREVSVRSLNGKWSSAFIPKIGRVRFRSTRPIVGKVINVTVSLSPIGWVISFNCEYEQEVAESTLPPVGVDRGIANTLTLSTGEMMSLPEQLGHLDKQYGRARRSLSRKKKGSKRRLRALKKAARISAKRARIRKDWHHKASRSIADRFSTVVMENLNIKAMTRSAKGTAAAPGKNVKSKSSLNRSILNQGWGNFGVMLKYKLEERGGELVTVDPKFTSQTCSCCGTVDRNSRKSQAVFSCDHCGFVEHADINAAINILRRWNTPCLDVEEGRWASDEASTKGGNALNLAA